MLKNPARKEREEYLEKVARFIVQKELGASQVHLLLTMLVSCGRYSLLQVLQDWDTKTLSIDSALHELQDLADKSLVQELRQHLSFEQFLSPLSSEERPLM